MDYLYLNFNRLNRKVNKYYIFVVYYLPFIIWLSAVWIGTSLPTSVMKEIPFSAEDKLLHMLAYLGLGFLFRRLVVFFKKPVWRRQPTRLTLFWGLLLGGLDEIHQLFIPGRDASLGDFAADGLGIVAGILVFTIYMRLQKKSSKPGLEKIDLP